MTKSPNENLSQFIKDLDPHLTLQQMVDNARKAGFKPVRGTSKPIDRWLATRVSSLRHQNGISAKGKRKPITSSPHAAPAPAPSNGSAAPERKVALGSVDLTLEQALRNLVKRIGTERAREILDEIEAS